MSEILKLFNIGNTANIQHGNLNISIAGTKAVVLIISQWLHVNNEHKFEV